jgi:hypothetical protein
MIADGVSKIWGLKKSPNCPPIPRVDTRICISHKHDVHIGFIDREEAMNHVYYTGYAGEPNDHPRGRLEHTNHIRSYIRPKIDVDKPPRKVLMDKSNVLNHARIIPVIIWTVQAERKDIHLIFVEGNDIWTVLCRPMQMGRVFPVS